MGKENTTKPRVLMTNLMLAGYSGSELHTLDMAKEFIKHGWDVTCFTLVLSEPIRGLLHHAGVKTVEFPNINSLDTHYDLLFAQHHVVSDFIAAQASITFDRILVSILGPHTFHEQLPELAANADLIVYVSEECREARKEEAAISTAPYYIFPNYAHEGFASLPERTYPASPQKIAIVSNHLPQELVELKDKPNLPFSIETIGWNGYSRLTSSGMLSQYDCVITIGRTVLDCFSGSIPLYCYDQFGGPGYISPDEVEKHAYSNFSGRSVNRKLTSDELIEDIISGYPQAITNLSHLREYANQYHNLSHNFDALLDILNLRPISITQRNIKAGLENKSRYLCEITRPHLLEAIRIAEIYWGEELGEISEERKQLIPYYHSTVITLDLDELDVPANHRIVRFDPHTGRCTCTVLSENWQAVNAFSSCNSIDTFLSCAPAYLPLVGAPRRTIQFVAFPADVITTDRTIDKVLDDNVAMKKRLAKLESRPNLLERITSKFR